MFLYERVRKLKPPEFRRLTGVKPETFAKMVEILAAERAKVHRKGGRNPKLSLENTLLMVLEYLREYRTIFHISQSYGIAESSANKAIHWVEETLAKSPEFQLPSRRILQDSEMEFEVFVVDATETPIERPKKK